MSDLDDADRLTEPQARLLARVRASGEVVLNGRARRTVEALVARGLVTSEYALVMQSKGNGLEAVERFTVRPREEGS